MKAGLAGLETVASHTDTNSTLFIDALNSYKQNSEPVCSEQ